MRDFKVGDRVRVYDGAIYLDGNKGTITQALSNGQLAVRLDVFTDYAEVPPCWPQQLRRLKKKPKPRIGQEVITVDEAITGIDSKLRQAMSLINDARWGLGMFPPETKKP